MEAVRIKRGTRIDIYALKDKGCIIFQEEFFDHLGEKIQKKILARMDFLSSNIPSTIQNERISRKLKGYNNLFELKADFSNTLVRIFYFFSDDKVVFTHGFIKESRKTPPEEIKRALDLRRRFLAS
jgi:phage-related protein